MNNDLIRRLKELAIKRKESLEAWRELDGFMCLWCGAEDFSCRELKVHGRLKITSPRWFDIHNTGFPGYGTVICPKCLEKVLCLLT